jgi:hypothetical protein
VVFEFEMRVWEADEYLFYALFWNVVAEILHGVGTDHADVVVLLGVKYAESSDLLGCVVCYFLADFEAEDEFGSEDGGKGEEKPTITAADIEYVYAPTL